MWLVFSDLETWLLINMSLNSFICEAHQQEATQFCLCETNLLFICTACIPKHESHESYPIAQSGLFQAIGRDKKELKWRNTVSRNCQVFLDRVIEREAAVQSEAKALISQLHQSYEVWLKENHRCFETLLLTLREETALLLTRPKYRVSPITQLLFNKQDALDAKDEERFANIPESETLKHLLERCQDVCSRASGLWQEDYREELLQAFAAQKAVSPPGIILEQANSQISIFTERLRKWGITTDPPTDFQEHNYSNPQSNTILAVFGSYSGQDDELLLMKRPPATDANGVYIGQWNSRGQKHGYGKYLLTNGDVYEGQWRNGQMTGMGRLILASNLEVYEGNFVQSKMEGFGTAYLANGNVYSGAWVNDKAHGIGSHTYGGDSQWAGDRYIGEYREFKMDGIGAWFYSDGGMYVGSWKSYTYHGKGVHLWANGEMYFGDWEGNLPSGIGCYVWPNGDVYRGAWKQGKKNGQGKLTHPGTVEEGIWMDNVLIGRAN